MPRGLIGAADPWYGRVPAFSWNIREEAWLVGAVVATPDERAEALAPRDAVAWTRFGALGVSEALVQALDSGRVLLVVRPSGVGVVDQVGPAPIDLVDLTDDEPPPPLIPPREDDDDELHRVDVLVVNVLGEPQAGIAYELTLPDGTVRTGRTSADGHLRIGGLSLTGNCQLTFPELTELTEAAA